MKKSWTLTNDEEIGSVLAKFEEYKDEVSKGNHWKTSQFWPVSYLDIMQNQLSPAYCNPNE